MEIEWTKQRPTKPGIYWRHSPAFGTEVVKLSRSSYDDVFYVDFLGTDGGDSMQIGFDLHPSKKEWWFGPLVPPELPEEAQCHHSKP